MSDLSLKPISDDFKKKALKICQEFLGPPWRDITFSQFRLSTVRGGLSNSMYRCTLPEDVIVKNSKTPRDLLLRIYGPLQDNTNIIVTETTTFMLLAERKLGPKLYGVFPDGRLEEFIPSRTLKTVDYRKWIPEIAKEFAKIHALDVPIRKIPDFLPESMKKWTKELEEKPLTDGDLSLLQFYKVESEWLMKEISKSNAPVVYCHNDLQGGNILLREAEEDPKIILIDFEFGAYNHRTFDLANQFCEWCFDYLSPEFPYFTKDFTKFPTIEEQTTYVKTYLEQLVKEGVSSNSSLEEETQEILREVNLFASAAHILWSVWSFKMSFESTLGFAHREHSKTRKEAFKMFKERHLNSVICNGESNAC